MEHDQQELLTDSALIAAAEAGDEAAFTQLYDRHASTAWRLSLALTGDPDQAAESLTEGFARTFTALRSGRCTPDTSVRELLLTSVRNADADRHRDRHEDDTAAAGGFAYADAEATDIAAAFAPLPERWRSVLWLADVEGMRIVRIAPVVGLAPQATSKLLDRARAGLAEQYLQTSLARTGGRDCARATARFAAYLDGTLSEADVARLESHLETCEACRDREIALSDLGARIGMLSLPLPGALLERSRAAWTAAVVTPARSTRTGLSTTAEKVLAGVSAVAAAVGILGATLFTTNHGGGSEAAMPIAPAATEAGDTPVAADAPVVLPSPDGASGSSSGYAGSGLRSLPSRSTFGATTPTVAAPGTGTSPTGAPGSGSPSPTPDSPGDVPATGSDAPITVDTTIAGIPVVIEGSEDPGATVGDTTVGSPPPSDSTDDSTIQLDGPLEPLSPVIAPVDESVTGLTSDLGL